MWSTLKEENEYKAGGQRRIGKDFVRIFSTNAF
jgi:hypothetical protein